MIKCILYPRSKLCVTSGGKEQSAQIVTEKVTELCTLVPALERELDRRPGKTREGKDAVRYIFRNGSWFDNLAASERSRGARRHAMLIEECIGVDGDILSQVLLPVLNIDRRAMDGTMQPSETLNKSQLYITTAGYKNTFSYDKLIQFLIWMVINPEKAFIMGGTFRIPVLAGLQNADFISDLKRDGTFNAAAFNREYESKWIGTSEGAFFDGNVFDRSRTIRQPDFSIADLGPVKSAFYVISADIGRKGDLTAVSVIKVIPQPTGAPIKHLVNLFSWEDMHFEDQAIKLKKLYYQYQARRIVIDGNGIGAGVMDYMVKPQILEDTGERLPSFGVYNDPDGSWKKDYVQEGLVSNAIYEIKANAPLNTEAHVNLQVQLANNKLKLLIDERTAQSKLLASKEGEAMSFESRADYLKPFTLTSILKEELMNLREEAEGINVILKRANSRIHKDKVSSLEYALYYIKVEEESNAKRKKFNVADWKFFN